MSLEAQSINISKKNGVIVKNKPDIPVSGFFFLGENERKNITKLVKKGGVNMNKASEDKPKEDKKEIFCRFIVRNGKKIYPKHRRFFHFFV